MPKTMTVSAAEANRSFSKLLRATDEGNEVMITSRGKLRAKLVPVGTDEAESEELRQAFDQLLAHLRKAESVVVGPWTREELYDRDE